MKRSSLGRKSSFPPNSRFEMSGIPVMKKHHSKTPSRLFENAETPLCRAQLADNSIFRTTSAKRPPRAMTLSSGSGFSYGVGSMDSSGRPSGAGGHTKKDNRPINDKDWQNSALSMVNTFLLSDSVGIQVMKENGCSSVKRMTIKLFIDLVNFFFKGLNIPLQVDKANYVVEVPFILKKLRYRGKVDKSVLQTVGAVHSWSYILGILHFFVQNLSYIEKLNNQSIDILYPSHRLMEEEEINFKFVPDYIHKVQEVQRSSQSEEQKNESIKLLKLEICKASGFSVEIFSKNSQLEESKKEIMESVKKFERKLENILQEYSREKELIKSLQNQLMNGGDYDDQKRTSIRSLNYEMEDLVTTEADIDNQLVVKKEELKQLELQMKSKDEENLMVEEMEKVKLRLNYEESCLQDYKNEIFNSNLKLKQIKTVEGKLLHEFNLMLMSITPEVPELFNAGVNDFEDLKKDCMKSTDICTSVFEKLSQTCSQLKEDIQSEKEEVCKCEHLYKELELKRKALKEIQESTKEQEEKAKQELNSFEKDSLEEEINHLSSYLEQLKIEKKKILSNLDEYKKILQHNECVLKKNTETVRRKKEILHKVFNKWLQDIQDIFKSLEEI